MSAERSNHLSGITKAQYDELYPVIVNKLKTGLPPYLTYHNLQHTLDVLEALEHLIIEEEVCDNDAWLLLTAGLLHDAGFITAYSNHEEHSCTIAKAALPLFGYPEAAILKVEKLIMATRLPQTPQTQLERIICDADLYYLGSESFFLTAENLYHEFRHEHIVATYDEWQSRQIKFLEEHRFFTNTALAEQEARKQEYISQLRQNIK